jgi:hypothetical protein
MHYLLKMNHRQRRCLSIYFDTASAAPSTMARTLLFMGPLVVELLWEPGIGSVATAGCKLAVQL